MNERNSLFDLATLPFELTLHNHHRFLVFPCSENQKAAEFLKLCFLKKKGWTFTHEECPFLLDMDFHAKEITNLTSNFT
jgi:hypothetical protein